MKKTVVANLLRERFDVYIGRGSKWRNPFRIGVHGNREEVIRKYKDYLLSKPELMGSLEELRGKVLGCFCKPKPCHGDVLVELLDSEHRISGPEMKPDSKQMKLNFKLVFDDDNYWGHCQYQGHRNYYLNLGRAHWMVCDECKIKWFVGENLFSSWRSQTEDMWMRNWEHIKWYREVSANGGR
jgi:hypothetical protein